MKGETLTKVFIVIIIMYTMVLDNTQWEGAGGKAQTLAILTSFWREQLILCLICVMTKYKVHTSYLGEYIYIYIYIYIYMES